MGEGDGSKFAVPLDLESKHPVDFTHIMDFKVLSKSVLRCLDEGRVRGGDGKVVNVSKQDGGEDSVFSAEKYSVVVFGSGEADISKDFPENLVPSASTLFESIERLQES